MQKVLIASPIRNKEYCLEKYLSSIENLDYDKKLISVFFITNNNTDKTSEILKDFKERNKNNYRKIEILELNINENSDFAQHEWNPERLNNLAKLRDMCLEKISDEDFIFMVDADVELRREILKHLISLNKEVCAELVLSTWATEKQKMKPIPNAFMLLPNGDEYTGGVDENFGMKLIKKGTYECDIIMSIWLIRKDVIERKIRFSKNINDADAMEFKLFSKHCRENKIKQCIDTCFPCKHMEIDGSFIDFDTK